MKESLESMVQHLGFSYDEEPDEQSQNGSFRHLIQRFRDKGGRMIYEAVFTEHGLQCSCHEWQSRKCCRHVVYVFDRLSVRDEYGRIIGISQKVTSRPREKVRVMDFRNTNPETERWLSQNLEIIEI